MRILRRCTQLLLSKGSKEEALELRARLLQDLVAPPTTQVAQAEEQVQKPRAIHVDTQTF